MGTNSGVLTVSDTLDIHPFPVDVTNPSGAENVVFPDPDDAIRARLADIARQEEKRRQLVEFLRRPTPAWNPDDHPDIDAAGGAAAWVRKLRHESDRSSRKRIRRARS